MTDIQPGQYFDPAHPNEDPAIPSRQRRRRVHLLVAGAAVLVVLVLLGVYVVNTLRQQRSADEVLVAGMLAELAMCADEADHATCEERIRERYAERSGSAEFCAGLNEADLKNCVIRAAKSSNNLAACEALSGEARDDCRDLILIIQANATPSFALCEQIASDEYRQACVGGVTVAAVQSGNCASFGVEQALCDAREQMLAVAETGTRADCLALDDQGLIERCLDARNKRDRDGDGLTLRDEARYGTSDETVDSDGDGYADDVEVAGGYDPTK